MGHERRHISDIFRVLEYMEGGVTPLPHSTSLYDNDPFHTRVIMPRNQTAE